MQYSDFTSAGPVHQAMDAHAQLERFNQTISTIQNQGTPQQNFAPAAMMVSPSAAPQHVYFPPYYHHTVRWPHSSLNRRK